MQMNEDQGVPATSLAGVVVPPIPITGLGPDAFSARSPESFACATKRRQT